MAVVADSYGAAEEASGPAEVTGAGVGDVVVAADRLLRRHGDWARCCAAHDAVSAVGLVGHAGVSPRAHHVGARLFALALVHDLQVWVSHAAGHQQNTLILICLSVTAAHRMLPGNVRAVWRARALRPSHLHLADLPGTAFDSLTSLFAWFAGDDSQEAQQADLIHGQAGVGPCCVQATPGTALLSGHPSHQHHVAPLVLTLLQPAHPRAGWITPNLIQSEDHSKSTNQKSHCELWLGKKLSSENLSAQKSARRGDGKQSGSL